MKAQVFAIVKRAAELLNKEGVRALRNGLLEVKCDVNKIRTLDGMVIYAIEPKYPIAEKHYFELQVVERGERNIGQIVTNLSGKKLIPRWRGKNIVGFRTSKGQLIAVIGYAVRGMVEIINYAFQIEGQNVFLTERGYGPYEVNYNQSKKTWIVNLPNELKQLGDAVVAAMEKATCNCFRKGCQYHYALSEEEAKKVLAERQKKQNVATEKPKTQATKESKSEEPKKETNSKSVDTVMAEAMKKAGLI